MTGTIACGGFDNQGSNPASPFRSQDLRLTASYRSLPTPTSRILSGPTTRRAAMGCRAEMLFGRGGASSLWRRRVSSASATTGGSSNEGQGDLSSPDTSSPPLVSLARFASELFNRKLPIFDAGHKVERLRQGCADRPHSAARRHQDVGAHCFESLQPT